MILNFIRGFCMALADSVPGVSGGTIAFLLGFYDQFITSLDALMSGTMEERKKAIVFLCKIGIGWVVGFISAVLVLANIFETNIYQISSLFIGFIIFAIPIVVLEEKECMKATLSNILALAIGIGLVFAITYFNPVSGSENGVDLANLTFGLGAYIFFAGMVAISAMVLPGISGSTLLLIFGLYVPIISAIKAFLHFELQYFWALCLFGLGILTGIVLVIKIIRWALANHRSVMIFLIIGMMIGSIYAIIMGPQTLVEPKAPMTLETFNILWFVVGGTVIIGLQQLKKFSDK